MPSFRSTVVFPGLPCTLPKGSVLSWAWAQAEGKAREGGPLPFQREEARDHFRHWQVWVLGSLCHTGLAGRAFRLLGASGYAGSSTPREPQPSPAMLTVCDP